MARCDLHMHSTRSDGRYDPDEVLRRAARGGLELLALTDHDVPDAVPPGVHTLDGRSLTVIAGVEVSTTLEGHEQHLLVYFGGPVPEDFRAFCRAQCVGRAARWQTAGATLGLALPPIDADALAGTRALTRFHLARQLVAAGRCRTPQEAFVRFIGDAHGVVPCAFADMVETVARARRAGGVPVWAHPQRVPLERRVAALTEAGLLGLEGLRPSLSAADRHACRKIARKHGLFVTGGSDWHGWSDSIALGLWSVDHRDLAPFFAALA